MFFKLAARGSRRNRRENGLFFASLLVSIVAFYIILSLSQQDVMIFLQKMESDAVNKLFLLIPVFYVMTLVILFFLIYFASRYQLERRSHEFGVWLMMGMRRPKLFLLLLVEDLRSSLLALAVGLPVAVLISELISLITARLVGLGIIGHRLMISVPALCLTAAGFLAIKFAAFVILSGRIARREIGTLLTPPAAGTKKQLPGAFYALAFLTGVVFLGTACVLAIRRIAWSSVRGMGLAMLLGFAGMLLLFFGLRAVMDLLARRGSTGKVQDLRSFTFRQLQENVIHQSVSLAVSALLVLAGLGCFGAGIGISLSMGNEYPHVLDYTFESWEEEDVEHVLQEKGLDDLFGVLFPVRTGYIRENGEYSGMLSMKQVKEELASLPDSWEKETLLQNVERDENVHLLNLSGYNHLLELAGEPQLSLSEGEAAVFVDSEFVSDRTKALWNELLEKEPEIRIRSEQWRLTGVLQDTDFVTDRSITLSLGLIVPDEAFMRLTEGNFSTYWDAVLSEKARANGSLLNSIMAVNEKLDAAGLEDIEYESYLQNIGRQLFYVVAASYITIYLAVIFLIVANTVLGVQFLTGQQKTERRFRTLVRLGATYESLYGCIKKQVNWYFGIPVMVAAACSMFGVRALLAGFLSMEAQKGIAAMLPAAAAMILVLCVVEWIYMASVKRSSARWLRAVMEPAREE